MCYPCTPRDLSHFYSACHASKMLCRGAMDTKLRFLGWKAYLPPMSLITSVEKKSNSVCQRGPFPNHHQRGPKSRTDHFRRMSFVVSLPNTRRSWVSMLRKPRQPLSRALGQCTARHKHMLLHHYQPPHLVCRPCHPRASSPVDLHLQDSLDHHPLSHLSDLGSLLGKFFLRIFVNTIYR